MEHIVKSHIYQNHPPPPRNPSPQKISWVTNEIFWGNWTRAEPLASNLLYLFTSVLGRHQVDEEVSGTDSPRIYMPSTRQLVGNKSCARNVPLPGPPEKTRPWVLNASHPWGLGLWQGLAAVYILELYPHHHIFFGATRPKGNKELRDTSSNAHYFNFPGFFKDSRSTPRVGISLMGSHRAGIEFVMYCV